ncbi:MAG: agmatine deiminase family protein [Planctomycetota bacterium]
MEKRKRACIALAGILMAVLFLPDHGMAQSMASLTPPLGPVHCIAEWEESEGVILRWHNPDLIKKMQADINVYIPVEDEIAKDDWVDWLTFYGIPLTNIEFLFIKTDSRWTRDYGPWFIWDGAGEMGIVDFIRYPTTQPWDELFNWNFSQLYGINYYDTGIHHIGGNWYPNAYGNSFSSNMVYHENIPMTKAEVDAVIYDYLGIDHYHTVTVAPLSLEHLDCWVKPCNPETLLVVQFPDDSKYLPFGEDVNDYYATLESPWGRPYKIIRLPMFKMGSGIWYEFRPYMNSLVSNKQVYVPICNHPDDDIALSVFQEAFPGYEIIGADHYGTGWGGMSIHCTTKHFHKRKLIRIYPYPPGDRSDRLQRYTVRAEVIPPNGSTLLPGYPVIHWTLTGGAPFDDVVMTPTGQSHEYEGDIPAQAQGALVSFYIEAQDDGGLDAIYPLVAPDGMMTFEVRLDNAAPELSRFMPVRSTAAAQWPPVIRVLAKDDMTEPEVKVEYEINGVPQADVTLVREHRCYWYSGMLAGNIAPGDVVTYRVVATDTAAAPNTSVLPKLGDVYCPIKDSGSVAVVDLDLWPRTGPFIAETLGNLGIPCVRYTTWPSDWRAHDVWFICLGIFAYNHILSPSEAADIVAALQGGGSIYMESGDAWCYDPQKTIVDPWFKVNPKGDGGELYGNVNGEPGTLMEGIGLEYVGEHDLIDVIAPLAQAVTIFRSEEDTKGRAVLYDAGSYKTVASSFALGGLRDGTCPDTRKEILVRYLQFFGKEVDLHASAEARMGTNLPLKIKGAPGDKYLLFGSFADNYVNTGYGAFRLHQAYLFQLWQGKIPASGMDELIFPIPRIPETAGYEIHLQAVVGEEIKVGKAQLTNRELLTLIE